MILGSGYYSGQTFSEHADLDKNSVTIERCVFQNGVTIDGLFRHHIRDCVIYAGKGRAAIYIKNHHGTGWSVTGNRVFPATAGTPKP